MFLSYSIYVSLRETLIYWSLGGAGSESVIIDSSSIVADHFTACSRVTRFVKQWFFLERKIHLISFISYENGNNSTAETYHLMTFSTFQRPSHRNTTPSTQILLSLPTYDIGNIDPWKVDVWRLKRPFNAVFQDIGQKVHIIISVA